MPLWLQTASLFRSSPEAEGLFGALIPTGGDQKTYLGTLPNLYHMHPWEMALIHGAGPNKVWMPQ